MNSPSAATVCGMEDTSTLPVWRRAHELSANVHAATFRMPPQAIGARTQLRRAAAALVTLLAEAAAAPSPMQCARQLQLAINASGDLEALLESTGRSKQFSATTAASLQAELLVLRRALIGLRRRVMAEQESRMTV